MSKISRRKFIASSAVAVGSGIIGGAALSAHLSSPIESTSFADQKSPAPAGATTSSAIAPVQKFDFSLDFTHWSFGGIENSSPLSAKSSDFKYWFDPVIAKKRYFFREEVLNACKKLDKERNGKEIALCFSGGLDSEIIALALEELKIPYELYFLDFFGLNKATYKNFILPFTTKLKKEVNVVCLAKDYFIEEYARKNFLEYGCELPTPIGLTYLFKNIPNNKYIVVGDGDLDRQGDLFKFIGKNNPTENNGWFLAYSSSSVLYHLWAQKNQKQGSYYFFSSTPELIASAITDPLFGLAYPLGYTRSIIHRDFPEILPREKTTNWDTPEAREINSYIRNRARAFTEPDSYPSRGPQCLYASYPFWKPSIGTAVDLNGIFFPEAPKNLG